MRVGKPGLEGSKQISPYAAACFRILLGSFFLWQSVDLVRTGGELVPVFLKIVLPLASLFLILGCSRRIAAGVLWLGLAWLYATKPLFEPAGAGLTGILLLFQLLLPTGEGLQWNRLKADPDWRFPLVLFWGSWVLLALYYGWNGVLQCQSPSWTGGSAVAEMLQSILVEDGRLREILLSFPNEVLRMVTYVVLAIGLLFPLLSWLPKARPGIWLLMLLVQIFWFFLLDDGVGSLGLILFQLWILDPDWFPPRQAERGKSLVLYDGVCGMCNGTVQFLLGEDGKKNLVFAALQGKTAEKILGREAKSDLSSVVYIRDWQTDRAQKFTHSDAVFQLLKDLGGFWRVVSWIRFIPRIFRDIGYQAVARIRYRAFGKYDACRLPEPGVRERFLD